MTKLNNEKLLQHLCSTYGGYWRYPQLIDFCYLVNPFFPTPELVNDMRNNFDVLMREYPSGMNVNSNLAAVFFDVKQENIVVGNGAAELIKALMENWTGVLGYVLPTFEEYPNRRNKENLVSYLPQRDGFKYTADDLMTFFDDKIIDTLLVINPDNPSGNYVPFCDLLRLLEWSKHRGIRIVIDESFVDFASGDGRHSLLDNVLLEENPHLVVVKSISKSYGVPGLRLGVLASGNTDCIAKLKKQVAIWNINSFGEYFMQIYKNYHKDFVRACELFREERELFLAELKKIPYIEVYDSQANYFLCRITERFSSHDLAIRLLEKNILIKDCGTKKGFNGGNYVRLAVRDRKDNHFLTETMKEL